MVFGNLAGKIYDLYLKLKPHPSEVTSEQDHKNHGLEAHLPMTSRITNKPFAVRYKGLSFPYLVELYRNEKLDLRKDIGEVLRHPESTVALAKLDGRPLTDLEKELPTYDIKSLRSYLDIANHELYRSYLFKKYSQEHKNIWKTPLELLSIASHVRYGGIGASSFKTLKNMDINTAMQLSSMYDSGTMLEFMNRNEDKLKRIKKGLKYFGLELRQ